MPPITQSTAAEVWRILRDKAGASNAATERDCFIFHATGKDSIPEYRFRGELGFGGKVYYRDGKWGVYYYPEDRNDVREEIQRRTNEALSKLNAPANGGTT